MNIKEKCCCFTGHRIVPMEHIALIRKKLPVLIKKLTSEGVTDFIAGGALGFDTIAAQCVLEARAENPDIRLILALPCRNQTNNWRSRDILEYNRILALADEVIYVSEQYTAGCMHKRNRFMADHSSHCIFYLTSPRGGTAYTVKYALESRLQLHNILR